MNTKSTSSSVCVKYLATWALVAACLLAIAPGAYSEEPSAAMRAYELRMAGKADEGKALLEQAISANPKDGAAHYEMARTLYHMALGKPQKIESLMERAQQSAELSTQASPKSVMHHVFAGHIACIRGYSHMMHGTGSEALAKEQFTKARAAYESAMKLKPDYGEAALYLIELHTSLPENMGADKAIAKRYAKKLKNINPVFAAKADAMLKERNAAFWEDLRKRHAGNADVLEELGKAYLGKDRVDANDKSFVLRST